MKRVKVVVEGDVQGVGFRWWVLRQANTLELSGSAENLWDGSVEVHAQGPDEDVDQFVRLVTEPQRSTGFSLFRPGRPGHVASHTISNETPVRGDGGFDIR